MAVKKFLPITSIDLAIMIFCFYFLLFIIKADMTRKCEMTRDKRSNLIFLIYFSSVLRQSMDYSCRE